MEKNEKGILRIGTSGIVVPGSKDTFPDAFKSKSRLSYYSSLFNTIEINSTFRKIPRPGTMQKWAADVGENFQFTLKVSKQITHTKKLELTLNDIDAFFAAAENLQQKAGCILFQFPGSITADFYQLVQHIFQRTDEVDREGIWRRAVEFRSLTWYSQDTYQLLDKYNVSLVQHDMPKSATGPVDLRQQFFYFRFHGPTGDYRGSYSDAFLKEQAEQIIDCLQKGKDCYIYFNNTMGNAYENAITLQRMIRHG